MKKVIRRYLLDTPTCQILLKPDHSFGHTEQNENFVLQNPFFGASTEHFQSSFLDTLNSKIQKCLFGPISEHGIGLYTLHLNMYSFL